MKRFAAWTAVAATSLVLAGCGGDGAPVAAAATVKVQAGGATGKELADVQILRIGRASCRERVFRVV